MPYSKIRKLLKPAGLYILFIKIYILLIKNCEQGEYELMLRPIMFYKKCSCCQNIKRIVKYEQNLQLCNELDYGGSNHHFSRPRFRVEYYRIETKRNATAYFIGFAQFLFMHVRSRTVVLGTSIKDDGAYQVGSIGNSWNRQTGSMLKKL